MERRRRVYPAEKTGRKWLSAFLLLAAVVVFVSGLFQRRNASDFSIRLSASTTPIPMNDSFDETPAQKETTLGASRWYALQLGAFENAAAASEYAAQFVLRGAGGYVWQDGRYRVLAAVYPSRDDAQQVREQLETKHGIDSYLYEIDLPQVQIRLSGMQGQLDILEAAFLHANDLVVQLQNLSIAIDRRETSSKEVFGSLQMLAEQMQTVSLRLSQRFAKPRHASVEALIHCFDQFSAFHLQLSGNDNSVDLGARLKYQTLYSLNQLKRVYDSLGHT